MNYLMTFTEGLASFVSPCTLPLMPVFVAYFAADGKRPFGRALAFVLGFSSVFIALGVASAGIGSFLAAHQALVRIVSGALLVFMALVFAEIVPLRLPWSGKAGAPPASAFLFGMLFAVNLTPCVGAFLAAALVAAANADTVVEGATLLAVYSLGLALPFIAAALALAKLNGLFARIKAGYRVLVPVCTIALLGYGGWMIYDGAVSPTLKEEVASIESGSASDPAAEPAAEPQIYGEVIEITSEEQFHEAIASGTSVVDFWAPWCGPCRRMGPIMHEIAAEMPNVKILKVNVDDFQSLARSYNISGIPAIFRIDHGTVTASTVGSQPKQDLIERLNLK